MSASQSTLNAAITLHQQGKLAEAQTLYETILITEPNHVDALHLLGVIAINTKHYERAVELIDKAIHLNPTQAAFYSNRGSALQQLKRFDEAIASYNSAIAIQPDYATAYSNRGLALQEMKHLAEAISSYDRAIAINPTFASAHYNRGNALQERKKYEDAIASYDHAIAINPNFAESFCNRGNALKALKRFDEAIVSYDRAIAINSNYVESYCNRGLALQHLKYFDQAIASYNQAIAINSEYADVHYNKALALLLLGDVEHGWDLYEWRFKLPTITFHDIPIKTPWDGKKLSGSLLVLSEQGIGDVVFYSNMLNDLSALVDDITVLIEPRLLALYQRSFKHIKFITTLLPDMIEKFDAQLYMPSLGRYFRATQQMLRHIKSPYLYADKEKSQKWHGILSADKKLICGLSWISKNHDFGEDKTLRLQDLIPILSLPHLTLIDLQYGDTTLEQSTLYAETGIQLTRIPEIDNFKDIDDLTALIDACDIILTVSNTTAHLAAALGKPVIIMLPYTTGLLWYWHENRSDNPWYPTAKLIRQPTQGDWQSVVAQVKLVIESEINQHRKKI